MSLPVVTQSVIATRDRAGFHLNRLYHTTLYFLKITAGRPVPYRDYLNAGCDPRAEELKLFRRLAHGVQHQPNPAAPPVLSPMIQATPLAVALGSLLPGELIRKNAKSPFIEVRTLLSVLPKPINDWLTGTPPIPKNEGGLFFEALGVIEQYHRGDFYQPTTLLRRGIELSRAYEDHDDIHSLSDLPLCPFPDAIRPILRSALRNPEALKKLDGRTLRALKSDNQNVVLARSDGHMTLNPTYVPIVELFATREQPSLREVFLALPDEDQDIILGDLIPENHGSIRLLCDLGFLAKRGVNVRKTRMTVRNRKVMLDALRGIDEHASQLYAPDTDEHAAELILLDEDVGLERSEQNSEEEEEDDFLPDDLNNPTPDTDDEPELVLSLDTDDEPEPVLSLEADPDPDWNF